MGKIAVPQELTYVGVFLTFRCKFHCSYCINRSGTLTFGNELTAQQWVTGLNRLNINKNLKVPITLSGGEPSMFKGWVDVISGLDTDFYIDILTNLDFDIYDFINKVPPERLQRDVPYASIRVSYHPEYSNIFELLPKIYYMQQQGYSIGLFAVDHPEFDFEPIKNLSDSLKVDFRMKEFLGEYKERIYGKYKYYTGARSGNDVCKTTELLIAPDGNIHKCHRDLYSGRHPIGNILDDDLKIEFKFRKCEDQQACSPCDIKLKNNRFQKFGACSVQIEGG